MGSSISLPFFSFIDGILIAVGTGPLGIFIILRDGICTNFGKTCIVTCFAATSLYFLCSTEEKIPCSCTQVVVITGCDTGLGFSFAQHANKLGFLVIAGFLNLESEGCLELKNTCGKYFFPILLDITKDEHIKAAQKYLKTFFMERKTAKFHALINNAGVMAFGEFEWLTDRIMQEQINVNIVGSMKMTRICLPLLRQHKGRIITIGSHCAAVCLPGLAVYGATKAALHAWSDGLRLELTKYGIHVIKFVPGSLVVQTNIMSRLCQDKQEIQCNMTDDQRIFYGNYLDRYYSFLQNIPVPKKVLKINNPGLYAKFESALMNRYPKPLYKHEPFHYKLNHFMFKVSPTWLRDALILRFVHLPEWAPKPVSVVPLNLDI